MDRKDEGWTSTPALAGTSTICAANHARLPATTALLLILGVIAAVAGREVQQRLLTRNLGGAVISSSPAINAVASGETDFLDINGTSSYDDDYAVLDESNASDNTTTTDIGSSEAHAHAVARSPFPSRPSASHTNAATRTPMRSKRPMVTEPPVPRAATGAPLPSATSTAEKPAIGNTDESEDDEADEEELTETSDGDNKDSDAVVLGGGLALKPSTWRRYLFKLQCFRDGRWEYNPAMANTGPRLSAPGGGIPSAPGDRWQWQTRSGEARVPGCTAMPRWNRVDFCRVLRGRKVLVLGDSLSRQFHVALQDMASPLQRTSGDAKPSGLCRANGRGVTCRGHRICGFGGTRPALMTYRRTDRLLLDVLRPHHVDNFYEEPWAPELRKRRYDVILLNRGAHYEGDAVLLAQWRRTLAYLRANHPHAMLFVRDTPPGHAGCIKHSRPLVSPQAARTLPHHWGDFQRQNRKLRQMVQREFSGVVFVDFATATALRPDQHLLGRSGKDCLHYVAPRSGATDHWVRSFFSALWLAERMRDGTAGPAVS